MTRQRTITRSVHAIGVGVHSGKKARLTLRPAPIGHGIQFVRRDVQGSRPIRALATQVSDTLLSTSIAADGVQISTVEHLMSALWGLGIDNLRIELRGEEVPILDGSAGPFVDLLRSAGIVVLDAPREFIRIKREVRVAQGDAVATLRPYAGFRARYTFVADHPVYNRYPKRALVDFGTASYVDDVSRARSFGLVDELPQAHAIRKCLGSSLENAVGISAEGVMNPDGLRYEDEFVRHKILDAIGDLYLLGKPVLGEFEGYKSGHSLNNQLARTLLRVRDSWEIVTEANDDSLVRVGVRALEEAVAGNRRV
jgi:UDP-3-O-[3-hydroxymyristoyl] N-acetylglucosamine deacetylase